MDANRFLIVNADDFGLSEGTNRGIIEVHEHGIVTSASLMVRQPAATAAAEYARLHPEFSIGLHIDLGEWEWRDEAWVKIYETALTDNPKAVTTEVEWQIAQFRALMGRAPTHLDSHQHVHHHEPLRTIAMAAAESLQVPLRGIGTRIGFCGHFYGLGARCAPFPDGITVGNLLSILHQLPAGTTELCCHPGRDEALRSCYRQERIVEVETLCDSRIRNALVRERIHLASFATALLNQPQ